MEAKTARSWLYGIILLATIAGLILSAVSWLKVCTEACSQVHNWRLLGLPFETMGGLFFIPVLILLWMARDNSWLMTLCGFLYAGAAGAELKFVLIQKYQIGAWCPVCLTIASCIFIATAAFVMRYILEWKEIMTQGSQGNFMHWLTKGFTGFSVFLLGFLVAAVGTTHFDPLAAAENTIKDSVAFGQKDSPIEVYVFTDWACPACREVEKDFEKMAPEIMSQARLTFVDHAVHTETLNYSPYNVSFMIKAKPEYFRLREALTHWALSHPTPTDEQIEKIAKEHGVTYEQLNFSDIALSQKYFKQLATQFGVKQTPTLVIINTKTKKGKKLIGVDEITASNVKKAISSLKDQK